MVDTHACIIYNEEKIFLLFYIKTVTLYLTYLSIGGKLYLSMGRESKGKKTLIKSNVLLDLCSHCWYNELTIKKEELVQMLGNRGYYDLTEREALEVHKFLEDQFSSYKYKLDVTSGALRHNIPAPLLGKVVEEVQVEVFGSPFKSSITSDIVKYFAPKKSWLLGGNKEKENYWLAKFGDLIYMYNVGTWELTIYLKGKEVFSEVMAEEFEPRTIYWYHDSLKRKNGFDIEGIAKEK